MPGGQSTDLSKAQQDLFAEHFGHIVVMLDGDDAGRRRRGVVSRFRRGMFRLYEGNASRFPERATDEISDRLRKEVYRVKPVSLADGQPSFCNASMGSNRWCGPPVNGASSQVAPLPALADSLW